MKGTIESRFLAMVNKDGPVHPTLGTKCWLWMGSTDRLGYGHFNLNGKTTLAHRVALTLFDTPIPRGRLALHRCDNPSCVKPAHLFTGTDADNSADCVSKGRSPHGERNAHAKLTERCVRTIRTIYAEGRTTYQTLARWFDVHHSVIGKIVIRKTWRQS